MRDAPQRFAAEFVGTFALVFVGGGAIIMAHDAGGAGLLAVAMAHGLILALMVTATAQISGGHLNPAVTIGLLSVRRITSKVAGVHILAQLLGASFAALALKVLMPPDQFTAAHGTIQEIASNVSIGQAFGLEAIATFFLVFMVFGTAVDPEHPKVGGFAIGLTIAADILAIGPLTGGSMNPARSFGPALVTHNFVGQFVYWLGPITGGIVAAMLYEWMLRRRTASELAKP